MPKKNNSTIFREKEMPPKAKKMPPKEEEIKLNLDNAQKINTTQAANKYIVAHDKAKKRQKNFIKRKIGEGFIQTPRVWVQLTPEDRNILGDFFREANKEQLDLMMLFVKVIKDYFNK